MEALGLHEMVLSGRYRGKQGVAPESFPKILLDKKDGSEQFIPLIKDLINDPYEVWVQFMTNDKTGQVIPIQLYVSIYKAENKVIFLEQGFFNIASQRNQSKSQGLRKPDPAFTRTHYHKLADALAVRVMDVVDVKGN